MRPRRKSVPATVSQAKLDKPSHPGWWDVRSVHQDGTKTPWETVLVDKFNIKTIKFIGKDFKTEWVENCEP